MLVNTQDVDQSNYLWIIPTEPNLTYNFNDFKKVSPLYVLPVEEEIV